MRSFHMASLLAVLLVLAAGCSDNSVPAGGDTGTTTDGGGTADTGGRDGGLSDTGTGNDSGTAMVDTGGDLDAGALDDTGTVTDALVDIDAFAGTDAFVATDAFVPPDTGNASPTCTITAPLDGTARNYNQNFTFVATASDPEDGPLSGASVVWRSNLVVAPLGSGLSVTTMLIPGVHTIRCTATDSVGNTGSSTIMVTSRSPVAQINHPGDGEVRPAANPIPFVGVGNDFEDGVLPGTALAWTSSIDGSIGTGNSFSRTLSAGTNVITLTVTDSMGNTGSTSITLTITP
jgi:hypothetical protein